MQVKKSMIASVLLKESLICFVGIALCFFAHKPTFNRWIYDIFMRAYPFCAILLAIQIAKDIKYRLFWGTLAYWMFFVIVGHSITMIAPNTFSAWQIFAGWFAPLAFVFIDRNELSANCRTSAKRICGFIAVLWVLISVLTAPPFQLTKFSGYLSLYKVYIAFSLNMATALMTMIQGK